GDRELSQLAIDAGNCKEKAGIQLASPHRFNLFHRTHWLELQFRIGLSLTKHSERIRNHAVPGDAFNEPHSQCSRLAGSYTFGAFSRLIDLLKNPPRILHEAFAGRAYLHSTRHTVKEFETNLLFQILNLARKGGLSHAKSLCGSIVMLLLTNGHEVSQMSQFHFDTVS